MSYNKLWWYVTENTYVNFAQPKLVCKSKMSCRTQWHTIQHETKSFWRVSMHLPMSGWGCCKFTQNMCSSCAVAHRQPPSWIYT
jgi:hypothetical protein